jgi:hypothetical protein
MDSRQIFSKISQAKDAFLPAIVASVTKYVGIEHARDIDDSDLKDKIKHDFATISGIVNVAEVSFFSASSFSAIYQNWSLLTTKQKAGIAFLLSVAVGSGLYSLSQFGHEQTSMTAGCFATLSSSWFFTAKELSRRYSDRNAVQDSANINGYATII